MRRFPLRTLLLMALALAAFVRLYFISHRQAERPAPSQPVVIETTPTAPEAGSPASAQACRTLDRALEGAVRAPADATAAATARQQLDTCSEPPARACELGAALDARAPIDAGTSPLRELLDDRVNAARPGTNPCAGFVTRAVMGLGAGRPADPANVRWHLEHAGPTGTPAACAEVTQSLLAPSALVSDPLSATQKEMLAQLAPACAHVRDSSPRTCCTRPWYRAMCPRSRSSSRGRRPRRPPC